MRKLWGFLCLMLIAGCAPGPAPVASNSTDPSPKPIAPVSRPASAPAGASASLPTPGQTYVIKPGDSLWKIAKAAYNDGTKYERIIAANPGLTPERLKPGAKIVIPML